MPTVGRGSRVEIVDLKTGRKEKLQVVRSEEWEGLDRDQKRGSVTEGSPLGRALEGRAPGEIATFLVSYGERSVRIVRVW